MKNSIMLAIFLLIYIAIILVLFGKLIDIIKRPDKYDHERLQRQANDLIAYKPYCKFFKSLSHQYSFVGFFFSIILTVLCYYVIYFIHQIASSEGTAIFMGTSYIGVIASFFLNTIIGMAIIPLSIKKPFFAVMVDEIFNVNGRRYIYQRSYKVGLILFIITFPFIFLSANNYTYYTPEAIYSSRFFQIGENVTPYSEIKSVAISIHHNNSGQVDTFKYVVTLNNDVSININNPNSGIKTFTKDIYRIHKYIEEKGICTAVITPLNDVDYKFIYENLSQEDIDIILYIFEGFHR